MVFTRLLPALNIRLINKIRSNKLLIHLINFITVLLHNTKIVCVNSPLFNIKKYKL
jgi:hypothetical protein